MGTWQPDQQEVLMQLSARVRRKVQDRRVLVTK